MPTITFSTRFWTCENCAEKIKPGEKMVIYPGANFYHFDCSPENQKVLKTAATETSGFFQPTGEYLTHNDFIILV